MGIYRILKTVVFDGIETGVSVDVSDSVQDARTAIYNLYAPDGSLIEGAVQPADQFTVRINISPAPLAGAYRLVGIA